MTPPQLVYFRRTGPLLAVFGILIAVSGRSVAAAQSTVTSVAVTAVEANAGFPDVTVQALALDSTGAFIPGVDANQFAIKEDGQPSKIERVRSDSLPVNLRLVFVIDELSITSRLPAVRDAIQSFAKAKMQPGDSIEVLSAGDQGKTQTIVPFTGNPDDLFNGVSDSKYSPNAASSTKLLKAVKQGLVDLSALSGNKLGSSRIVVFSVSMIDQIDLDDIVGRATNLEIPVHTVLLSNEDAQGALGRLARGTLAGNGTISTDALSDLFDSLNKQRNRDQYLITYRSRANKAGDHKLVVEISAVSSTDIPFALDKLEPPKVLITDPSADSTITRTETAPNQKPQNVEPTEQTIAVAVSWPDGHPRNIVLERTVLVVNGESLGPATTIRDNGKDPVALEFKWDLTAERTPGTASRSVVVEVEDELGLTSKSDPLPVTLDYASFTVVQSVSLVVPILSLAVAVTALALVIVFLRRNPKVPQQIRDGLRHTISSFAPGKPGATILVEPLGDAKASLLVLEGHSGTSQQVFGLHGTTTVGRSSEHAQLVLQADNPDRSPISRLHCSLLEHDGNFEIRDEGSANGTFVNGVRLAQRESKALNNGDILEIAQVQRGGVKLKFEMLQPGYVKTRAADQNSAGVEGNQPSGGYTPTKKL